MLLLRTAAGPAMAAALIRAAEAPVCLHGRGQGNLDRRRGRSGTLSHRHPSHQVLTLLALLEYKSGESQLGMKRHHASAARYSLYLLY
jgi:hypothetical protein